MNVAIVAMALAIPFGAFMSYHTGDTAWLLLCGFLLIFLS